MKTLLNSFFIVLFVISSYGQNNSHLSDNYTAVCNNITDNEDSELLQTTVSLQNDSIIIEDVIYNQCCPEWALKISEIENDSMYVAFADTTTTQMCDCMCYFDVKINAGKATSNYLKVNYNGVWYNALPKVIEQSDTVIIKNSYLELEFKFETYECGINIFKHPANYEISRLDYLITTNTYDNPSSGISAVYTYKPKDSFVGVDTVVFVTGCGSTPDNILTDTIEYIIKVTGGNNLVYYYNETKCFDAWHTGEGSTIKQKRNALSGFLDQKGIESDTIEISSVYGLAELCESCMCLSGDRFYVTAPDYYLQAFSDLHFDVYYNPLQNPDYILLTYAETQCNDPWYGEYQYKAAPTPLVRLNALAQFLAKNSIEFLNLEIILTVDLDLVDLCLACYCSTGYKYDIVVEKQYVEKLIELGFQYNIKPLIEVGKKWNSLNIFPNVEDQITFYEHTIESDETGPFCWNGKFYHEVKAKYATYGGYVNPSDTITQYIREQNGKVYIVDLSEIASDGCEEALLYDFTLDIGDTVTLGFDSIKYVVVPIETTEIQGRRCMALADLSHPEISDYTIWIEGIGDTRGLFKSVESLYIDGSSNVLTCCFLNDGLLYKNPQYPDCGATSVNEYINRQISISPNPTEGMILIKGFENMDNLNYSIVNSLGKVEQEGILKEKLQLNLNKGFYLLIIREGERRIAVEKLIVK